MEEISGTFIWGGQEMTVIGTRRKPGDKAPDFKVLANDFSEVALGDSAGKVRLISVVPSLDTSVCDAQTRRFNQEAANVDPQVVLGQNGTRACGENDEPQARASDPDDGGCAGFHGSLPCWR